MRIRIVSDGTPPGTRITDADTGEELTDIVQVDFHLEVHEAEADARLTRLARNRDGKIRFPLAYEHEDAQVVEIDAQAQAQG